MYDVEFEVEFPGELERWRADMAVRAARRAASAAAAAESAGLVAVAQREAVTIASSQVTQVVSSEPVFPIKPPGGATGSSMTVETGMDRPANQRENPTAARSHVAIDETTVSANGISEASNSVHVGARDTAVPDGPIVLRLAELNFIELNLAGDDHNNVWRGTDDASSEVNE